ncbi:MAG: PaaI family thioesterase [Peptococcaceae bacterium]|nr:MAG: PaaI family thioesterase [Peptococcaceae bacterium]
MKVKDYEKSLFWQLLDIKVRSSGPGRAELGMRTVDEHTQLAGVVHGGAVASLIDSAVAAAIGGLEMPKIGMATIEMKVNYLAPVLPGDELVADARIIQNGRKIVVGTVEVFNQKRHLVAFGTATYMIKTPPSEN